jgi:hypothetical protein
LPRSHNAMYCPEHRGKKHKPEDLRELSECFLGDDDVPDEELDAIEDSQLESLLRQNRELSISRRLISRTIRETAEGLLGRPLTLMPKTRRTVNGSRREAIVCLGDWQLGKYEGGVGVEELRERLSLVVDAAKSIVANSPRVDSLTVLLLGDLVEGIWIYPGQVPKGIDLRVEAHRITRQILETSRVAASVINELYLLGLPMRVISVPGNHGRVAPEVTDEADNFDTLCACFAKELLSGHDIQWDICQYWVHQFESAGVTVVATHGDRWRGTFWKLHDLIPKWVHAGIIDYPDVVVAGHRHEFASGTIGRTVFVQNGALDGGSGWLTALSGLSARSCQVVLVVSDKHSLEAIYPIFV